MPLDEVRRVFLERSEIYPQDNAEEKRKFFECLERNDLITLSDDSQGNLKGFVICYRSFNGDYLNKARASEQTGDSVVVDLIWIRPDLRDGLTIKKIISHSLRANRYRNAGAEKIFIHVRRAGDRPPGPKEVKRGDDIFRFYDYPSFYRKFA